METFHIVNPQVVRETLMRKETGKEHPGLLEEGVLKTLRDRNVACCSIGMFFKTVLLHPWEAGSSLRAPLDWKPWVAFSSWFKCFGQLKPPRAVSILEGLRFESDYLSK